MQVFGLFLLCFQRKNVERFNVKVMAATVLNSTQVHLLQMFQVDDSQQGGWRQHEPHFYVSAADELLRGEGDPQAR